MVSGGHGLYNLQLFIIQMAVWASARGGVLTSSRFSNVTNVAFISLLKILIVFPQNKLQEGERS